MLFFAVMLVAKYWPFVIFPVKGTALDVNKRTLKFIFADYKSQALHLCAISAF